MADKTYIHFAGGDKVRVEGTPDAVANELAPTKRLAHGFHEVTGSADGKVLVNRDQITHLSAARSGGSTTLV